MAGSLDKLIADMRAAQGLAPDPLQDQLTPAAVVPSTIQAPELSMETSMDIDAATAGVADLPPAAPQLDMAGLVDQAAPMPLPDGMPVTAQPMQPLASESSSTKKVVGNRKYAQGGAPVSDPQLAAIAGSVNPEAEGASQAIGGLDAAQADVEKATRELAVIEGERALAQKSVIEEDDRVRAEEMARQEQFQVEAEQKITAIDQEIKEFAAREPDPGRFWSSRNTGQKALYLITAALQAFSKPEEVPKVADVLGRFIDQDIKIQEDRLARELSAAQGRGKSVRELITMGKEKDAAVYALRVGAVESLEKMLDADFRAKGASPKAELAVAQSRAAMAELRGKYFKEAADGERSNREMIFKAEEARKARAFQRAEAQRERAYKESLKTPEGIEMVLVEGVEGGAGSGEGIIPNPAIKNAPQQLAEIATGYTAGAKTLAEGKRIAERIAREGNTPQLDAEWNAWVTQAQPSIARSRGHTGVLTQKDVVASVAGSGYQIIDEDGLLSLATLRNLRTRPDSAAKFLDALDSAATTKTRAAIKAYAHPNQGEQKEGKSGWKLVTAQEYRDRASAEEATSAKAASDDRTMAMAGMDRKSGMGAEKLARETARLFPGAPISGRTPGELQMGAVVQDGRGSAATRETKDALYAAKDTLDAAARSAKTPTEKMDMTLRAKRAEAGIFVIENTPPDRTPAQHARDLRKKADTMRASARSRDAGVGGVPRSKEEIRKADMEATAYEAAIKLATGAALEKE